MARSTQEFRTLQEAHTTLSPAEVIASAKNFFPRRNSLYATFLEREGPAFATFRGQGGEEIVIAAQADASGSRVTGSSYMFDMQVARFLSMLPPYPSAEHDVEAVA